MESGDLAEHVVIVAVVVVAALAAAAVEHSSDSVVDAEEDAVAVVHVVIASQVCQTMSADLNVLEGPKMAAVQDMDHPCSNLTSVGVEMAEDSLAMVVRDVVIVRRC